MNIIGGYYIYYFWKLKGSKRNPPLRSEAIDHIGAQSDTLEGCVVHFLPENPQRSTAFFPVPQHSSVS